MDEQIQPVVDPEVRAFVNSLVSAVGGTSIDDDGRYVLGDDALACLKDLKRWLKLYDEKLHRLDVARCLAEANLVRGDLLEILATWPDDATEDRLKSKIALACLELLGHLTWPLEFEDTHMTVNHHRHLPYLQLAQVSYKRAVLQHDARILHTAVRVALPSMALPRKDRTPRDEGIIKLVLFFIRNVAVITHPPSLPSDDDEAEISRSATIESFHAQDILHLLLTVSSTMGDEFTTQDVTVLEILFHLLKGISAERLFMKQAQLDKSQNDELRSLISKEKAMLAGYAKHAPTRHNRFGTMVWVKRDDEKVSVISGQKGLGDAQGSLVKMDTSKRWNKPRRPAKSSAESPQIEFDKAVHLSEWARKHLRAFVEEFLDSSFNPLFQHVRKAIEREADRVLKVHSRQFCYLASWFLEAHCARRKAAEQKAASRGVPVEHDTEGFALVASVLNQETFVLLNRFMQRSLDDKAWQDVNAAMKCFTQILLTVQEISDSASEDDQEIAENIQNRIFYEEATQERVITLVRSYKDQGFGYLDACTELAHVFLRMLERYSKQNADLQVRSRRRARRKRKAAAREEGGAGADEEQPSEAEDLAEAQRATKERKFDFSRFCAKFVNQASVNTFVAFARYHDDLEPEQLKRAHRFFYRVAFKMELTVLLFRVDIIHLFNMVIKGPCGLDPEMSIFKEWEELICQVFRRLTRRLQDRPELMVEMLFSKVNASVFFLEHGYEKEQTKKAPRAPAELVVKGHFSKIEQIGIVVTALVDEGKSEALDWLKGVLSQAADEREAWELEHTARQATDEQADTEGDQHAAKEDSEAPSIVITPDNDERRLSLFKDKRLRLLFNLLSLQRLGAEEDPSASWSIPSSLSTTSIRQSLTLIQETITSPPDLPEGNPAEKFLISKAVATRASARRAAFDDDDKDGDLASGEEDFLFPAGGPTSRAPHGSPAPARRRRRLRHAKDSDLEGELDADAEAARLKRAEARSRAETEKRRKIKSDLYVRDSDDEDDEERDREFFRMEEERRVGTARNISTALGKRKSLDEGGRSKNKKQRRRSSDSEDVSSDDHDDIDEHDEGFDSFTRDTRNESPARSLSSPLALDEPIQIEDNGSTASSVDNDGDEGLDNAKPETPPSSHKDHSNSDKDLVQDQGETARDDALKRFLLTDTTRANDGTGFAEDGESGPVRRLARRSVRAGFVIESDSD